MQLKKGGSNLNPNLPDLEGDVIHGRKRTFYSVRIIALCMAVAALVSGLVSVPVVLILANDASDRSYQTDVKTCNTQNKARRDANIRLKTQRQDAHNLGRLTHKTSEVRAAEADAFVAIAHAFKIEKEVAPLVKLLNEASSQDLEIANEQDRVIFKDIPLQDCNSNDVIQKP